MGVSLSGPIYPLVNVYIAIEAMAIASSLIFPLKMVDLSIVMLVYQRLGLDPFCKND